MKIYINIYILALKQQIVKTGIRMMPFMDIVMCIRFLHLERESLILPHLKLRSNPGNKKQ